MAFQEKAQKSYTSLGKWQRRPALAPNLNASSLGAVGGYSSLACPANLNGPSTQRSVGIQISAAELLCVSSRAVQTFVL
jgi:hypothetical protein